MEEILKNPEILSLKNSVAGVMLMMVIHILWNVAKAVWDHKHKEGKISAKILEENTAAVKTLTATVDNLNGQFPKMQKDLKRAFLALKKLAGDDWHEIRKEFEQDELM